MAAYSPLKERSCPSTWLRTGFETRLRSSSARTVFALSYNEFPLTLRRREALSRRVAAFFNGRPNNGMTMSTAMTLMDQFLPLVEQYLRQLDESLVPWLSGNSFHVEPLAQGEYNLNYLVVSGDVKRVFRLNMGTQIDREDQILYEYRALKLLEPSGVTPVPYFVDDSRTFFERGILVMEYLPGEPLNYATDLESAAEVFARIHRVEVDEEDNHLIREDAPLSLIYDECAGLIETYLASKLADPAIREYLKDVLAWAETHRSTERYYQQAPWLCVVNTEVNSHNFIVNRGAGTIHLVDWEMPRWGDPSQDLSHFCSPLTTLWKTGYRMSPADKLAFIRLYADCVGDRHLRDTLTDRVRLRDPFVYLRGISWSAMGWVAYQTGFSGVRNEYTWATLQRYMNLDFIRGLFDPFLSGRTGGE